MKLRALDAGEPAFLLESAEQGQRVGRYSFIGFRPREVVRWSAGDGGDPYALAAHDRMVRLYPEYRDKACKLPLWKLPMTSLLSAGLRLSKLSRPLVSTHSPSIKSR